MRMATPLWSACGPPLLLFPLHEIDHVQQPLHVPNRMRPATMIPVTVIIHMRHVIIEQESGKTRSALAAT